MIVTEKKNHARFESFLEEVITDNGELVNVEQYINGYGVKIRRFCGSCKFKKYTDLTASELDAGCHICTLTEDIYPHSHTCRLWAATDELENAGSDQIKRGKIQTAAFIRWKSQNWFALQKLYKVRYPEESGVMGPDFTTFLRNEYKAQTGHEIHLDW